MHKEKVFSTNDNNGYYSMTTFKTSPLDVGFKAVGTRLKIGEVNPESFCEWVRFTN
jgi:hypothetical protein